MIQSICLVLGGVIWVFLLAGFWIIPVLYALFMSAALGMVLVIQHGLGHQWQVITCAAILMYVNLTCSSWVYSSWQEHHYPIAPLHMAQFISMVLALLLGCVFFVSIRSLQGRQQELTSNGHTGLIKRLLTHRTEREQPNEDVSIVLGEKVEHRQPNRN